MLQLIESKHVHTTDGLKSTSRPLKFYNSKLSFRYLLQSTVLDEVNLRRRQLSLHINLQTVAICNAL